MGNATLATIAPVLEELYEPADVYDHIMRRNPMLAMIPHKADGGGKYKHVPLKYVRPQGRSATFSDALANLTPTGRVAFDVTWKNDYQIGGIDGDVIDDARGNRVMLIDHIAGEIEGVKENMADSMGFLTFGNGGGARGQVGSVAAGVITLADAESVVHFEVGMQIVADTGDGTATATARVGTGTVTDVDRDAGTVTYSGTITSIAANDYLFAEGDKGQVMSGFGAWIPASAPSATTFFGVDRTADATRMAGVRYDAAAAGDTYKEALLNAAHRVSRFKKGAGVEVFTLSPLDYAALDLLLEDDKRYTKLESPKGSIGFDAIQINTPAGAVKVISDPNQPAGYAFGWSPSTWELCTVGDMARILDDDGSTMLREAANDGYTFRVKTRGNFICREPSANCSVKIA